MSLVVLEDALWARGAAERVAERLRGASTAALAGGGTPREVYLELAKLPLPWERIDFFFGDERPVPPDHPESNYRMARETLFRDRPSIRVHRMEAERADRDRAAEEYAARLPERLDVLLLGMGADGHTASLFPGSPALRETRRVVAVREGRLTITPPVIASARWVGVLVRGAGKAAMVRRVLEGADVPAALARGGEWIVDPAASG